MTYSVPIVGLIPMTYSILIVNPIPMTYSIVHTLSGPLTPRTPLHCHSLRVLNLWLRAIPSCFQYPLNFPQPTWTFLNLIVTNLGVKFDSLPRTEEVRLSGRTTLQLLAEKAAAGQVQKANTTKTQTNIFMIGKRSIFSQVVHMTVLNKH